MAKGGVCTEAATGYFIPTGAAQHTEQSVVACNDETGVTVGGSTYKGIANCQECAAPDVAPGARAEKVVTCTRCQEQKYLKGNECVADANACGEEYAAKEDSDKGNRCIKCDDPTDGIADCAECIASASSARSGTPLVTCSQCSNKKVQPDKKGCIQDCPSHSTEKPQQSGICECDQGYIPDDAGTGCIQGAASQCKTPDCKTCTNPAKDNEVCTECSDGKYLTPTSQCISDCTKLSNYYASVNDKGKKACKGCMVANCLTCNGQGKCSVCKDGFYGESCSKCNSACRTCSGATAEDCTECPSGKALKYDTTEKRARV